METKLKSSRYNLAQSKSSGVMNEAGTSEKWQLRIQLHSRTSLWSPFHIPSIPPAATQWRVDPQLTTALRWDQENTHTSKESRKLWLQRKTNPGYIHDLQ